MSQEAKENRPSLASQEFDNAENKSHLLSPFTAHIISQRISLKTGNTTKK
jgi:hypothetical protein